MVFVLTLLALFASPPSRDGTFSHGFRARSAGEAVATIVAGCANCDWSVAGREAVMLELSVDGVYSQHLALTRGAAPAEYRVMLGALAAGSHRLVMRRDDARSAAGTGPVTVARVSVEIVDRTSPAYPWLSRAPILRARPGTVERFSDFPLVMYAEHDVPGEAGGSTNISTP